MTPTAIFVETNWIVDIVKPSYLQSPQERRLLSRAEAGDFKLYIPAICLKEAKSATTQRFSTKKYPGNDIREFIRFSRENNCISEEKSQIVFDVLNRFTQSIEHELRQIPSLLEDLANNPHIEFFPLSESMLERQLAIREIDIDLQPFDLAILAAILVKAEELIIDGHSWVGFCELDSDLKPWDRQGRPKPALNELYKTARIRVYGDFSIEDSANAGGFEPSDTDV